jgi:hypothetical protein
MTTAHTTGLANKVAGGETFVVPLLRNLALARATELARLGRYDEAESLVGGLENPAGMESEIPDLLARIRAQQGRFADARRLWTDVLCKRPGHAGALEALARLDHMAGPKEKTMAGAELIHQPWTIREPGLIVGGDEREAVIQFVTGPFADGGYELTEAARQSLTRLGHRLEFLVGRIAIEVTGSGDSLLDSRPEGFANAEGLGIARSYEVTQHLVRTTKLQEWMFLLRAIITAPPNGVVDAGVPAITIYVRPVHMA